MRHPVKLATVVMVLVASAVNIPAQAGGLYTPIGTPIPAESKYYGTLYPNENGPFLTYEAAVNACQQMLFVFMHWQGDGMTEYGSMIYQDMYGKWWHSTPVPGYQTATGDQVVLDPSTIRRPGCSDKVRATSHTHVYDPNNLQIFPDPNGDNLSGLPMFVQRYGRPDGTGSDIWYFGPNSHKPKLYGAVKNNGLLPTVVSKYAGDFTQLSMEGVENDLYHADPGPEGDAILTQALEIGGLILIGLVLVTGLVFGGSMGGGYTIEGGQCDSLGYCHES